MKIALGIRTSIVLIGLGIGLAPARVGATPQAPVAATAQSAPTGGGQTGIPWRGRRVPTPPGTGDPVSPPSPPGG